MHKEITNFSQVYTCESYAALVWAILRHVVDPQIIWMNHNPILAIAAFKLSFFSQLD